MRTTTEFYEWFDFDNDTKTLWIKTLDDESEFPYIVEIRTKDDAYCTLYDEMFSSSKDAQKHFTEIKNQIKNGTFKTIEHTCWWHDKPVMMIQSLQKIGDVM